MLSHVVRYEPVKKYTGIQIHLIEINTFFLSKYLFIVIGPNDDFHLAMYSAKKSLVSCKDIFVHTNLVCMQSKKI